MSHDPLQIIYIDERVLYLYENVCRFCMAFPLSLEIRLTHTVVISNPFYRFEVFAFETVGSQSHGKPGSIGVLKWFRKVREINNMKKVITFL